MKLKCIAEECLNILENTIYFDHFDREMNIVNDIATLIQRQRNNVICDYFDLQNTPQ